MSFLNGARNRLTTSVLCRPPQALCIRSIWNIWPRWCRRLAVTATKIAYPDSLVGTDSHTTMINGLGVLGWGVGGIEAEAVMFGQPIYMLLPDVVGFKLNGSLPDGATATDLVLRVTEMLRKKGVVGKFVEFYGPGLSKLSLPDRATIANMAPEYGATMGFFPVDEETLRYMVGTGRDEAQIDLVERYCKDQGLFRTDETPDPTFSDVLELDMSDGEAGAGRSQAPAGSHGFGHGQESLEANVGGSGRSARLRAGEEQNWKAKSRSSSRTPTLRSHMVIL